MPKKTYTSLPSNYTVCEHSDCPMAATCLHQLAYNELMKTETILQLLNPAQCVKNETCKFYRDNTPVTYARGFTNFQKKMYPDQYQTFMHKLIGKFSRNGYFERRRGASALSPKEQEIVFAALKEVGVTAEMKFDSYESLINWYDQVQYLGRSTRVLTSKYYSSLLKVLEYYHKGTNTRIIKTRKRWQRNK